MVRRSTLWRFIAACVVVTVTAFVAWSAPMVPVQRQALPAQLRSLTDLKQLNVALGRGLPDELQRSGMTGEQVVEDCAKALRDAGFEVVTDADAPRFTLVVMIATDELSPGSRGYVLLATLDQQVRVSRLDETMHLPTYVDLVVGIEPKPQMKANVQTGIEKLIKNLIERVTMASVDRK